MSSSVFIAVLFAALLHAGWNAILKFNLDRFLSITLITVSAGIISLLVIPFVGLPLAAAWPWLLGSNLLHVGYSLFLMKSYQHGDFSQIYPIARGTAPLLLTLVSLLILGEQFSSLALLGVLLLVIGVLSISLTGKKGVTKTSKTTLFYALGTSVFIASYTLTDSYGARANVSPISYIVWTFFIQSIVMLVILLAKRGLGSVKTMKSYWKSGLLAGLMSLLAYGIVIWATTIAPVALVATLRESSVLFGALIAILCLKEPFSKSRLLSAIIIVIGITLTKLG